MNEIILNRFKEIHGDKYVYMFDENKPLYTTHKVKIICPVHGEFEQRVNNHLKGAGCFKCGHIKKGISGKLSLEKFIEKANKIHKCKYDYSKVIFNYNDDKIIIICPIHGEFEQQLSSHISKKSPGCPKCAYKIRSEERRSSYDKILSQIPEEIKELYDYDLSNYKNAFTYLPIRCKKHGIEYNQLAQSFIKGKIGCVKCGVTSLGELMIVKYLNNYNIKYIPQHSFPECKYKRPLKFDFYLPEYNLCIEFDGLQHYKETSHSLREPLSIIQLRDDIKTKFCSDNKIELIRIPFWERQNINNILTSKLRDKFFELDT